MFLKRTPGVGIIYADSYPNAGKMKNTPQKGNSVILKIDKENILVKIEEILSNETFKGKIYGFEPSFSEEFKGLKLEESIEFQEVNIISCGE